MPDAGTPASIPVRFTVNEAGPRVLRFRVSPQEGELVTENNSREALVDVRHATLQLEPAGFEEASQVC